MAEETTDTIDTSGPQQYTQLLDVAEKRITTPELPTGGTLTPTTQQVQANELETDVQMPTTPLGSTVDVSAANLDVAVPSPQQAATFCTP